MSALDDYLTNRGHKSDCNCYARQICNCGYIQAAAELEHLRAEVVEDVKGVRTPVYQLKKRIVEAVHNIKIVEV